MMKKKVIKERFTDYSKFEKLPSPEEVAREDARVSNPNC